MIALPDTELTPLQYDRLAAVESSDLDLRVVGWHPEGGPILASGDRYAYLSRHGNFIPLESVFRSWLPERAA